MRGCFYALSQDRLVPYAKALFEAYWEQDRDIGQTEVVAANTEELIARGGFGSPTYFVNHADMYFGNDRLELVEAAIRRFASKG